MISHYPLAEFLEIDLLPINVQGFADPPGLIYADLLSLFHLAVPPYR
jgi:hypothetical protein